MRTIASAANTYNHVLAALWLEQARHWATQQPSEHVDVRQILRGRPTVGYPSHLFGRTYRGEAGEDAVGSILSADPAASLVATVLGIERSLHRRRRLALLLDETQRGAAALASRRLAIDPGDPHTRRWFDNAIQRMHEDDIVRLLDELSAALDDSTGRAFPGRGHRAVSGAGSRAALANAVVHRVQPASRRARYSVRQRDAAVVADTVTGLWRRNLHFPPEVNLEARLRWYYLDGPAGPGRVMLLTNEDAVVGCEGIGVRSFACAGRAEPMRVGLLGDLAVERAHRTLMPALTLLRAGRIAAKEFAVHYGFPNAAAAPLYERLGYRKLGTLTRWVRIVRHAGYLRRVVKHALLARVGGAVLDQASQAGALIGRTIAGPYLKLESLADTDERLDRLWQAAHRQWGMIGRRDAAFVRWRFLRAPVSRCELVALIVRQTGTVRAYAVLEPVAGTIHLRDFLGVDLRDVGLLLDLLVPYVHRRGAVAISVSFLGASRVEALLRAHHFHPRESTRPVIVDAAPGVAVMRGESWYLTDADEDT